MPFVKDIFCCSLCGEKGSSIDEYLGHMINKECCKMILISSCVVNGLLVPRYTVSSHDCIKKAGVKYHPILASCEYSFEQMKDACTIFDSVQCSQVDTGDCKRWKCEECSITFSRLAAFVNHKKLSHSDNLLNKIIDFDNANKLLKIKKEVTGCRNLNEVEDFKDCSYSENENVSAEPKLDCEICGQIFKSNKILKAHLAIVHSPNASFHCSFSGCNGRFNSKGSLNRHMRRHTGERPFKCNICSRNFRESGTLLRHKSSKTACSFKTDKSMPRYGKTEPLNIGVKQENIDATENNDSTLLPFLIDASENKQQVRTQIMSMNCTEVEDSKIELKKDDTEDLSLIKVLFFCPVCFFECEKEKQLSKHLVNHLDTTGGACQQCGKWYATRSSLSQHLLSHSNYKQFQCFICKKIFKLKGHAKQHLQSHSGIKSVSCPMCNKCFKTVSSRNVHLKIHENNRQYSCLHCTKTFITRGSLERHLRVHSGVAPFSCLFCGKKFKEHGTLKRHIKNKKPCSQQSKILSGEVDVNFIRKLNADMSPISSTLTEISDGLSEYKEFDEASFIESLTSEDIHEVNGELVCDWSEKSESKSYLC